MSNSKCLKLVREKQELPMAYFMENKQHLSGLRPGQPHQDEYLHQPSEYLLSSPANILLTLHGLPWQYKLFSCLWRHTQSFLFLWGMCPVKNTFQYSIRATRGLWSVAAFASIWMLPTFSPRIYSTISTYCEFTLCDRGLQIAQTLQCRMASKNRKKRRKGEGWREVSRQFCKANRVLSFCLRCHVDFLSAMWYFTWRISAYEELSCAPHPPPWLLYCSQCRFIKFWINMC